MPAIGDVIDGRYLIEGELGRGAMGVVFRGTDLGLARPVALKLVSPALCATPGLAALFQAEARALASVHSHHVVRVHAFGTHGASVFFAMELVVGRTLGAIVAEHLERGIRVPAHRGLVLLRQIAAGLDAVHACGLVHRDVKPDNVLVEEGTGRPVLVDFGLAARGRGELDTDAGAGTPGYMAPEQIVGAPDIDGRADVYAFACSAYELLTGQLPFDAVSVADLLRLHVAAEPPLPSSAWPDLAPTDAAFARALAKDPAARHATCSELVDEIAATMSSGIRVSGFPRDGHPETLDDRLVIQVVDDDPAFAKLCARAAGIAFFGVPTAITVAHDGREALAQARSRAPHLVLLDYDMPGLDGIETLSQLRAIAGCERTRAMVISGTASQREWWRFGALGVVDFLAKPLAFPELLRALEVVATRSGFRRAAAPPRSRR